MYSVLLRFNLNLVISTPIPIILTWHSTLFALIYQTMSSIDNLHQDMSCIEWVISSRTVVKTMEHRAEPWWKLIVIGTSFVAPSHVLIFDVTSQYISCTILMYFLAMVFLVIVHQSTYLGILSFAFFNSIKTMWNSDVQVSFSSHHLSHKLDYHLSYNMDCCHCCCIKSRLILWYGDTSPHKYLYHVFP